LKAFSKSTIKERVSQSPILGKQAVLILWKKGVKNTESLFGQRKAWLFNPPVALAALYSKNLKSGGRKHESDEEVRPAYPESFTDDFDGVDAQPAGGCIGKKVNTTGFGRYLQERI
jgi:hypothetical protein